MALYKVIDVSLFAECGGGVFSDVLREGGDEVVVVDFDSLKRERELRLR